jgi:hypothetical protein
VSRVREAATEQARAAATAAVAAEVARAKTVASSRRTQRDDWSDPYVAGGNGGRDANRRKMWALPLAAGLLLAVGASYAFDLPAVVRSKTASVETRAAVDAAAATTVPPTDPTAKPAARTAKRSGDLQIASTPAGAVVMLDGKNRGTTPVTLTDVAAGTHSLLLHSEAGTVKRSIVIRAGQQTSFEETIVGGFVAVFSRIPLEIFDGERRIGTTDEGQIMLPPGSYKLSLVNQRFGYRGQAAVDIRPGQVTAYTAPLPTGHVHLETAPGADVWVEGERVGTTPVGELAIPIGTREIVVRHAELGEGRATVEVKSDQPSEVTIALARRAAPSMPRLAPLSAPPAPRGTVH